ncbi:MAG: DUF7933 domain-containing protein [Solirubrobacteraceae bacterium]
MFVGLTVAIGAMAVAPAAALAASPPTLTSSFTPTSITVGNTAALTFTITNPNSSGSLTGIVFTDTLPAGLVVDDPNGQNGTCGSTSTLTAAPGSGTISLASGKLAAGASCTVSADVTTNTAGTYTNSTGAVSSNEGGSGSGDTQALTVFGNPTVSVTSPKEGAKFDFGQKVIARYSCKPAAGAPPLSDCSGDADNGSRIDTSTAGPQTFSVSAITADGSVVTQTIDYTVRPDNRLTITHAKTTRSGSVSFSVKVPGPGKLSVLESAPTANLAAVTLSPGKGRFAFARLTRHVGSAGTLRLTIKPDSEGARLVKNHHSAVVIRLAVAFTPKGGLGRTITRSIRITS